MSEERKIYLNKPQQLAWLINAKEQYHVWGRGTGKTEGPIALRSIDQSNAMPRGGTGIVAASYMQVATRTLPPLEKAWQRYGYLPGVHYWVGEFPDFKKLKISKAIYHPRSPKYSVFWWNGHVFHLMSLDRPGLSNGKSVDAIVGDEARLLNYKRFIDDIEPTNRGNREVFGKLSCHHAVTFCTDMPDSQAGKWILEKEKEMDPKRIAQILSLQLAYNELDLELKNPRTTEPRKQYLMRKMSNYAQALNELRKDCVFYSEASSLANLEILGEDQFKQWRRSMKPHEFDRIILNKRIIQVEKGFYPQLDLDQHTYDPDYDYTQLDNIGLANRKDFVQDCRSDRDILKDRPLDIAFDCNGYFNCCTIGQLHALKRMYRFLKSFYVKDNDRLQELCKLVTEYYRYHPTKEINFYYDHTFVGTDSTRTYSYADLIAQLFRAVGWKVNTIHIGQQPRHDTRYRMWESVMREDDQRHTRIRINKENCAQLLIALQRAAVRQGSKGFEKDKSDEKRIHTVPPEEATHLTDAFDTLYIGKFKGSIGYGTVMTDMIIG